MSIKDLFGKSGLIKDSAKDNEVMTYADPVTREKILNGFNLMSYLAKSMDHVEEFMTGILLKLIKIPRPYLLLKN